MTGYINAGEIAIVHDSASSLPRDLRTNEPGHITEVPFKIMTEFDGLTREWVDHPLSDAEKAEFVHYLNLKTARVTTSQPNPEDYKAAYEGIIKTGVTEIAVIPMSNQLSGSMESARIAAEELKHQANIVVADCKTVSIGQGLLITQADIENADGRFNSAAELVRRVEYLSKKVYVAQAFPSLDYLRRGGRIGLASSMVAGVLNIIPIIGVNPEGLLKPIDKKPRGWKNARETIVSYVSEAAGQRAVRLALVHFESDQVDNLHSDVENRFVLATNKAQKRFEMLDCEQGLVTCAHSGPGVIGLGALVLDK